MQRWVWLLATQKVSTERRSVHTRHARMRPSHLTLASVQPRHQRDRPHCMTTLAMVEHQSPCDPHRPWVPPPSPPLAPAADVQSPSWDVQAPGLRVPGLFMSQHVAEVSIFSFYVQSSFEERFPLVFWYYKRAEYRTREFSYSVLACCEPSVAWTRSDITPHTSWNDTRPFCPSLQVLRSITVKIENCHREKNNANQGKKTEGRANEFRCCVWHRAICASSCGHVVSFLLCCGTVRIGQIQQAFSSRKLGIPSLCNCRSPHLEIATQMTQNNT